MQVLVLVPTRELAQQVLELVNGFSEVSQLRSACVYGGSNKGPQLRDLERGKHPLKVAVVLWAIWTVKVVL